MHDVNWRIVILRSLLKKDGNGCYICGLPMLFVSEMDIDHVVPRSKGGEDIYDNLRVVHGECNKAKGDKKSANHLDVIAEKARRKIKEIERKKSAEKK